jgi:GTP-binding protein
MFTDSVTLTLSAGKGGNGVVAWRREKYIPKGGPTGGNGGLGGNIILETDTQIVSLQAYRNRRIIKAENGQAGGGALKQGRKGCDLILKIPCGTIAKDALTGETLYDFTKDKERWIICKGGRGGKGNACFKSPTHQAPNICTEGTEGEGCEVELELKLIADIGLVGYPNAGKSTLLNKATHLPVKIGAYPFTTLTPNLSYIQWEDYSRTLIADIPGIIEYAHMDKGLGLSFLKHIERTSALVYVIDVSGMEGRDPLQDFAVLQNELKAYGEGMLSKPFLIALNKIDELGAEENIARFRKKAGIDPALIFEISALEEIGLEPLCHAMRSLVQKEALSSSLVI